MYSKSIEQLENNIWAEPVEFPSGLVINCHKYRKLPIKDLTIEQMRLLISQKVGLEYLVGLAIDKLDKNVLAEGDFYEGDLLVAISNLPTKYWNENRSELDTLANIVELNSDLIKSELGEKKFDQVYKNLKAGHNY